MNSFTMAIHTVLETVSAFLHAGDTSFYLLLTCTSILFSVLIIFRRRKDQSEESQSRWVPASATSTDPIVASQTQTLKSSSTLLQNTRTTERSSTIKRKHGPRYQHTDFFPINEYNEDNRDTFSNGELHGSNSLESIPPCSNETVIYQHTLGPNSSKLLDNVITDSSYWNELSQCSSTGVSHMDELSLCTVTDTIHTDEPSRQVIIDTAHTDEPSRQVIIDTAHTDEPSRQVIIDTAHTDEPSRQVIIDTAHTDEPSRQVIIDTAHTDEPSRQVIIDTAHTDEPSRQVIIDTAHTDELSQCFSSETDKLFQGSNTDAAYKDELCQIAIIDTLHTDELPQRFVSNSSRTDELSLRTITDVSRTSELSLEVIKDISQSDEPFQPATTDTSHSGELFQSATTDTSHSDELFLPSTANTSHCDEMFQPAPTNTVHCDEMFQPITTDTSHCGELFQPTTTDTSHSRELFQPTTTDTSHCGELFQPTTTDTSHSGELFQPTTTDTYHSGELFQPATTYTSHSGELFQPATTYPSHSGELFQPTTTDTSHSGELFQEATTISHSGELFLPSTTDTSHFDELLQPATTDTSHFDELLQPATTISHSGELFQPATTDTSHSGELFQPATTDTSHSGELFQPATTDTSHSGELFQPATTDTSHSGEVFQPATTDTSHSGEVFQPATTDTSHSGELLQAATTDSHQLSHRENSNYNHAQEGVLPSIGSWCDCRQNINKVHCESTDIDHDKEIIHAFTDHLTSSEYNNNNSLYNKVKACTAKPKSMDTVLTCNQDNDQNEPLWKQLSLDSHQLPKPCARVRSSSISNIVHTRDKPARELRIRRRGYFWQPDAVPCTVTSCKMKAASTASGVYSPTNSDPTSKLYTSSHIHSHDQFQDSSCMFKHTDTRNNHVFPQETPYHQEPASSELSGGTYVTFVHSFPIARSRYRELRYSSERRASHSHRKISNLVYGRLEENSPQNFATTAHTGLRNSYSQEPMCVQTSCAVESNHLTHQSIPLHPDMIHSHVSHSNEPVAVFYRNPKQRYSNRIFRAKLMEQQDFPESYPSGNLPNMVPGIYQHPQEVPETALNIHELGTLQPAPVDTSASTNPQVELRRKRWGKSYCVPAERSQSMQIDFLSRPLSLAMPVISQSNDSLSRRKQITLSDMQQHLSTHTKGIFRKRVSVNNMLTWTKDPIQKPMIRSKDKSIRKEACEIFKMIQTYMGDRKGKETQILVALDVVTRGWAMPSLRDEIYVQLMRQTTDNKRDDSLKSGWELLAVCLYFFPPSPKIHPFLESYMSKHQESVSKSDSIPSPEMSAHCLWRLKRAQKMGTKTIVHKPTLDELEHAKATICCPTMFGNMLEDIMLLQRDRYPDRQLPWIQTVLSEEILRLHGAQTEGIFRVSGDIDEVNNMKTQCDKWILPIDCTDPHIPASLLKLWYRELFEPLIPAQFYQACVDNYCNPEAAITIVYQLPRLNHLVLCYLIRFLQLFASPGNVAFTKMDVNNLAMVMAPSCLRYESEDLLTIYQNVQKEMGFIRTLIRYLDTSFMEGIV